MQAGEACGGCGTSREGEKAGLEVAAGGGTGVDYLSCS